MALESKGLANDKSRIKMWVYTTKSVENKFWFSPAKENRKPTAEIIEGMKRRFLNNLASGAMQINAKVNVIIWYDVFTGIELERYKP